MLNLISVHNLEINQIKETTFDVGIFASGYESRSTFLAKNIDLNNVKEILILGFSEFQNNPTRIKNDAFYNSKHLDITVISSRNEKDLYSKLTDLFDPLLEQKNIDVLIDYTSMSRLWYSGILNFLRLQKFHQVNIFLNYSLGIYGNTFLDYSYSSINSLPSHEGSLSSNSKTLLVLSIGFSPYLIKSVIEEIEPNEIIGILAMPNIKKLYEKKSLEIKNDILTKDIDDWLNCPINDLESIFRTYSEVTTNNINEKDILFLSLGPKIFTLASILVSQRFEQVTCLYLKSSKNQMLDTKPTGHFIVNKIMYKL